MAYVYLVYVEPKDGFDDNQFFEYMKTFGTYAKLSDYCWLIKYGGYADDLKVRIHQAMLYKCRIAVFDLDGGYSVTMDREFVKWVKDNLN